MKAKRAFSFILVFFTFFLGAATALAEDVQIPAPVGDIYVQDFASVLTETERAKLINLGRSIEDQTTAQVAVLIVDTIGDRTIEDFANEAYRQYGIGSKKEDNGVLLVLAMKEQKVRIDVGYGLEGRIPDGKAGRILDEYAIPYLKNQQPNKAVIESYKALANEVFAEYGIEGGEQTAPNPAVSKDEGGGIPSWLIILIVVVAIFLDFKFFGGTLTYLLLSIISRGGGRGGGGGGSRGGGGGSSGGGGASRGW
ncbi:TPM domain-containing protein [Neobacillus sp. NPDC097160]|uniref:TPM domain-containing protein n=1 Tax=Neobacillus sp. NPDC097160 TaxID=3364298 RepID=UPI0037FFEF76